MAVWELVQGDITRLRVDVIVNAANSSLLGGGGVDGAIHRAAGPQLLAECRRIAEARRGCGGVACPPGEGVITGAGRLPCKKVIHTVGPVWHGGGQGEGELLAACYRSCLRLAEEAGLRSIAFPSISTGVYGYPKAEAAAIALETVRVFIRETPGISRVLFVCYDRENLEIYRNQEG
ncbi:MAG: O-acetyl-ADP-ribose deacetylase [Spirochaetaceae bacterium]|jgi:O-acetyl-ADP-ribose deacetylase (regulator of RNase III)|nr:O-acetyl-ADP-ribose deacetylase [Spirochaetaceae bacterium]